MGDPVEPVELVETMDRHDGLVPADVGRAVELPAHIGFAHPVGVEGGNVQAMGVAERLHGDVESGEAGRHLRAVAADADQMNADATVEQCGIDQVFHGPNLLPW
jgi:hypothetical protein